MNYRNRPPEDRTPRFDFDAFNYDRDAECEARVWEDFPDRFQGFVPLAYLSPRIDEIDDDWKKDFHSDSTYPPITVEICSDGLFILDGNHRVIVWRDMGFTHAPAWVVSSIS